MRGKWRERNCGDIISVVLRVAKRHVVSSLAERDSPGRLERWEGLKVISGCSSVVVVVTAVDVVGGGGGGDCATKEK